MAWRSCGKPSRRDCGILLVGGHYLTLDLGAALLSTEVEFDAVYRRNKNPAIEKPDDGGARQVL